MHSRGIILRGQSESLTDRIRGLLAEYSDGLAVPKELLQNADDAGATEVTLVLDTRSHQDRRSTLLDPRLAEWQGACLWAYNDAEFTQRDFENLCRLGGATKRERLDDGQVGKFGLGFNAVYNLTDVPSILSGHWLQILDPHSDLVGGGHLEDLFQRMGQRQTGVTLDISADEELVLREFRDQLAPFQGMLGCDLRLGQAFRGTLIRMPLRPQSLARRSRICQRAYSVSDAWSLLRQTAERASSLIMFAQSVRRLTLAYRGEGDTDCKILLVVERSLQQCYSGHGLPTPGVTEPLSVQCSLLKAYRALLKKQQQQPVLCSFTMLVSVRQPLCLSQQANQGFGMSRIAEVGEHRWLVTSALGGSEAIRMAADHPSLALSPVGSVAVRMEASSMTPLPLPTSEAAVFCFLPLPAGAETPPFPVLLNGAFALTSSRRHLLESTGDDRRGEWSPGQWNACLLSSVLAPAYLKTLQLLARYRAPAQAALGLWPQSQISRLWEPLALQLYNLAFSKNGPALFPSSEGWRGVDNCKFADPSLKTLTPVAETLLNAISDGLVWFTPEMHAAAMKFAGAMYESRFLSAEDGVLLVLDSASRLWQSPRTRSKLDEFVVFLLGLVGRRSFAFDYSNKIVTDRVRSKLRTCCCVPDGRKGLKKAEQLLSPKCPAAGLYSRGPESEDEAMFPRGDLCSDDSILNALGSLGMRTTITGQELVERAQSVARLSDSRSRFARVQKLLSFLHRAPNIVKSTSKALRSVSFLPVFGEEKLACPSDLFRYSCADLVSFHHYVLDEINVSTADLGDVLKEIGVHDEVSWDLAWQQLQSLVTSRLLVSPLRTASMCEAIYTHLSMFHSCRNEIAARRSDEQRLVFHPNGGFLHPQQVSLATSDIDLPPHLFTMRHLQDQKSSEPFLLALGAAQVFNARSYSQALARIHERSGDVPMSQENLRSCTDLLGRLIACLDSEDTPSAEDIFAPDSQGVLRACSELCYNNLPWLSQLHPVSGLFFTHNSLSFATCERLGVPTQREQTLDQICESFGQRENLTTRLAGILSGYPLGIELFKELIQNADDAEATEVTFINDMRSLPTKQVLSDAWQELQGPALLAFSNSVFTNADLEGIQSLGVGSKRSEAWKTGRFGIGFNCVYNVTDVPQFISNGEIFCVLDPHCKYTQLAARGVPGAKYSLTERHKTMFKDAFEGFLPSQLKQAGCTIFRLPLRTATQAAKSEICRTSVSSSMIANLFNEFRTEIASTMLFLTNLRRISLQEIKPNGEIGQVCVVNARASTLTGDLVRFNTCCRDSGLALKQSGAALNSLACQSVAYTLEIIEEIVHDLLCSEKWMVAQCVNLPSNRRHIEPPEELRRKVAVGGWPILPKVGVAARLSEDNSKTCRVFSLLPLPVRTRLPAHVNGCFALDPSRRALWCGHSADAETQWNELLTCSILPHCYAIMLEAVTKQPALAIKRYRKLLPEVGGDENSLWTKLAKEFYKELILSQWALLPCRSRNAITWLPLATSDDSVDGKSCFLVGRSGIDEIRPVLMRLGVPLIHENLEYLRSQFCSASECYIADLSPAVVANYLKGPLCANLRGQLPESVEKTGFKKPESVACLVDFITKTPASVIEATERLWLLNGTPLNLTADDVLDMLTVEKAAFLTPWQLFSTGSAQKLFAHKAISNCLQAAQFELSTAEMELKLDRLAIKSTLFKQFNVAEFFNLLSTFYPFYIRSADSVIKVAVPDAWLDNVWDFLSSESSYQPSIQKISILSKAALVPVVSTIDKISPARHKQPTSHLATVSLASSVLCVDRMSMSTLSNLNSALLSKLDELACPKLNSNKQFLMDLCGCVDKPATMISVLTYALKTNSPSCNQVGVISMYIQENWQSLSSVHQSQILCSMVKQLPIFVTLDDRCVSVAEKTVCVLSAKLADSEVHLWKCDQSTVLLKQSMELKSLFSCLGFSKLDQWEAYSKFILPVFSQLSFKGKAKHLSVLQKKFQKLICGAQMTPNQRKVVTLLKSTAIVFNGGQWHLASQFYDDRVEIFKHQLSKDKFLPAIWNKPEWRNLMMHAGLVCQCSEDLLLRFAACLESEGRSSVTPELPELRRKSIAIISHISAEPSDFSANCLNTLANTCFVVSESLDNLRSFAEVQQPKMIKLRDSVQYESHFICWTASTVCPQYTNKAVRLFKRLGVREFPTPGDFAKHLCTLLSSMAFLSVDMSEHVALRKQIMMNTYHYMQMHSLNEPKNLDFLQCAPFVLVEGGSYLLPAKCICLVPSAGIPPYIVSCPTELLQFSEVFQRFGATSEIVMSQLYHVLQSVQEKLKGAGLGDVEKDVVSRCLSAMISLLERNQNPQPERMPLFLPTSSEHERSQIFLMSDVQLLVINDAPDYCKRIGNNSDLQLLDVSFSKLKSDKIWLLHNYLRCKLGVRSLTGIVSERLADSSKSCNINGCTIGQTVKSKLTHPSVLNGMVRVLLNARVSGHLDSQTVGERLKAALDDLSVECMQSLVSVLSLGDKVLSDSQKSKRSFLVTKKVYTAHIEADCGNDDVTFWYKELAAVVNSFATSVLGAPTDLCSDLQTWLRLDNLDLIEDELDRDNLAPCTYGKDGIEECAGRGISLGSLIPAMQRSQLQELTSFKRDRLLQFEPGEIVALRQQTADIDSETFVYARIVAKGRKKSSNLWLQNYSIQLGDGDTRSSSALELFNIQSITGCIDIDLPTERDAAPQTELSRLLDHGRSLTDASDRSLALRRVAQFCSPARHSAAFHAGVVDSRSLSIIEEMHNYTNTCLARFGAELVRQCERDAADIGAASHLLLDRMPQLTASLQSAWGKRRAGDNIDFSLWPKLRRFASGGGGCFSPATEPPSPDAAMRYWRVACNDLRAGENDLGRGHRLAANWATYKAHQAAEKAMKAAVLAAGTSAVKSHHLADNLSLIQDQKLQRHLSSPAGTLAQKLRSVDCRYPIGSTEPSSIDRQDAEMALEASKCILAQISSFLCDLGFNDAQLE